MSGTDPSRTKALFLEALERSGAERARFLEALESEEPELAREVRALLAAHDGADAEALEALPTKLGELARRVTRAPATRLGDYELLEEVGSGAMGTVWRARQVSLDRIVALKLLRAGRLASRKELERLRAEAEAVARLDHPSIVPVYEVGEHEGHAFFSMRWIEGGTLAQRLGAPWPQRQAAFLCIEIARAVHHAHQRGLLHRDLKPSNVLMDAEGRPHVADFGIAKRLDGETHDSTTIERAGTPPYMAPEQIEGRELTVATDVWALGCLLYELLTGRPAFQGDTMTGLLRRICEEEPAAPRALRPELARDLETIVATCLCKEPARRYASAEALATDLERWLAHEPIAARRTSGLERVALFFRRSPLAASLIVTVSGLVVLLAAVSIWANVQLGALLRESWLGQARATRLSRVVGGREQALELLERAAGIRPGPDLRDEAIACLATVDLRREHTVDRGAAPAGGLWVDPTLTFVVHQEDDGALRLRSFEDGSVRAELGTPGTIRYLCWSPRGRWLLTKHHDAGDQGSNAGFHVWDVAEGSELLTRKEPVHGRAFAFSADERRLAHGSFTGEVVVLDLDSGAETARFRVEHPPNALCFDPSGEHLAVVIGDEERLGVYEVASGEAGAELDLGTSAIDACWTDDGLMVACADYRIRVFQGPTLEPGVVCQGHSAEVTQLFPSQRAPLLLSYSWDETSRLWDVATGREIRVLSAGALAFDADRMELAVTDERAWSRWSVSYGEVLLELQAHAGKAPRDLAFSADGRRLATAGNDGVFLVEPAIGARPRPVSARDARSVGFLADGTTLLAAGPEGLFRLTLGADGPASEEGPLLPGPLWGLALADDGRTLAVQGRGVVHLVDLQGREPQRELRGGANMEYLTMSADGRRLAAGNWRGGGVHLWDLDASDEPRVIDPERMNLAAALSPDGTLVATVSSERFRLVRFDDGEVLVEVERWREFGKAPAPVCFSRDGTRVAFGISSAVVRVVDTRTLTSLLTLEGPTSDSMFELAFAPGGDVLGMACPTNSVKLWKLDGLSSELRARGLDDGG